MRFARLRHRSIFRPRYRGVAPILAAGSTMSRGEYERGRDAHTWDPSRTTGLVIEADLAPAAWIGPLLFDHWSAGMSMLPRGFEAYARLFFPFEGEDLAERHERLAKSLIEPESASLAGPDGVGGAQGFLPPELWSALTPILATHTASARSWFLLWDGHGNLNERAFRQAPKVRHPARDLYLLSGPHQAYGDFPCEPNYCWPGDRAWCVCADTDWDWVCVAGSAACVSEILGACDRP